MPSFKRRVFIFSQKSRSIALAPHFSKALLNDELLHIDLLNFFLDNIEAPSEI